MNENIKEVILNHPEFVGTEYDLDKYDLYEYLEKEMSKDSETPMCEELELEVLGEKTIIQSKFFKIEVEGEYVLYLKRTGGDRKYKWKIRDSYEEKYESWNRRV
mgnify:CR=1 FL=1